MELHIFSDKTDFYIACAVLDAFRRFETISILVLTVVIVGNVVLIIRFTGGMIRPLKELATSANEVAKGNFDTNLIPVAAEDEIGIVTKAFNQMVVSIRQYIERLRQSMEIQQSLKEKEYRYVQSG